MSSTSVRPSLNLSMVATTIHDASISTIFGSTVTIPTIAAGKWATIAMPDRNLLAGNCTRPVIAQIRDPTRDVVFVYPQIGCSPAQQDCCPLPFQANGVGSYRACCPVVSSTTYSLYFMGVGQQTPCFAPISSTLVPEHMPPPETLTVQTAILARSLPLALPKSKAWIAGPVVGSVVFLVALVAAIWFWCFRRGTQRKEQEPDQRSAVDDPPVSSLPVSPFSPNQVDSPLVPGPLRPHQSPPRYQSPPYYDLNAAARGHEPLPQELSALGDHPACGAREGPSISSVKN